MDASMLVLSPGALTTVQDTGRFGGRHLGLPTAGCMDGYSQWLANWLVGNPAATAVLEITLIGPELLAQQATTLGIAGAEFEIFINDQPVECYQTLQLNAGDRLRFGRLLNGCRAYLAVAGGFGGEEFLGSVSTYLSASIGGLKGRALQKGDYLFLTSPTANLSRQLPEQLRIRFGQRWLLRVVDGVEADYFSSQARSSLLSQSFNVLPQSNRMGCRLKGVSLREDYTGEEMLTMGVSVGSIQVPSDGQPIVIMADGQTTGGYPRVAHIITADLHLLAQAKPGDEVSFFRTDHLKAKTIFREKQQLIKQALLIR